MSENNEAINNLMKLASVLQSFEELKVARVRNEAALSKLLAEAGSGDIDIHGLLAALLKRRDILNHDKVANDRLIGVVSYIIKQE